MTTPFGINSDVVCFSNVNPEWYFHVVISHIYYACNKKNIEEILIKWLFSHPVPLREPKTYKFNLFEL